MAAIIGILGESTVVTADISTTVYTVPASKAARVRILFAIEGGAGVSGVDIKVGTPGGENTFVRNTVSGDDVFSGISGAASQAANLIGLVDGAALLGDLASSQMDHILVPYPADFFLSTGDTVRFGIVTTPALDVLVQVHGVEDDA